MNLSGVISTTKSNKTNKNIFTVTKTLISFKFCFIFSKNYSNNREIKINLAHLHPFILRCFPNDKNIYLGRLICDIFSISTVIFGISTVNFSRFQGPNRFVALLRQSDKLFQNHNEYHKVGSFVRTSPLLARLQETLMTLEVYTTNQIFLEGFYHG